MTVYVDNMKAKYGRMIMCHMLADTDEELREMADKLGIPQKWHQGNHFDICLTKRALAVQLGAVEVTYKQMGAMNRRKEVTGSMGSPDEAIAWFKAYLRNRS